MRKTLFVAIWLAVGPAHADQASDLAELQRLEALVEQKVGEMLLSLTEMEARFARMNRDSGEVADREASQVAIAIGLTQLALRRYEADPSERNKLEMDAAWTRLDMRVDEFLAALKKGLKQRPAIRP